MAMVLEKKQLKASLAPALSRREFRLEALNGEVPKPMAEALALGRLFSSGRFREFQERLVDGAEIEPSLYNSIVSSIRNRKLKGEELGWRIASAFIRSGIYANHCGSSMPGLILDSFDVDGFPMHVVLTDSQSVRQNSGKTFYNRGKGHMVVNATTAAAHAASAIDEWLAVQEAPDLHKDEAQEACWKALEGEPRLVLAANAWASIVGRVNILTWNAGDERRFVADVASLFASSSAVHETAHVLDMRLRNGKANGMDPERCAYSMQAIYSHAGVALNSAEERGVLHRLFPELIGHVKGLGKAALDKGAYYFRDIFREIADKDFRQAYGKPYEEVLDTSVLKEIAKARLIAKESEAMVAEALHLSQE